MRSVALTLGVLTLGAAWLGPLPALAVQSFAAHMTTHMMVVAVAAPLLAAGVAGGALDPRRAVPRLFAPVPASIVELVVVWAWHAPVLHLAARHGFTLLALEQGMFLAAGLLLWLSALARAREGRLQGAGAGVFALLFTSMHMTLLGALFSLAPRVLYHHANGAPAGMSPLADQQLGGAIMLLVGGVSYLAGGLWLTAGLLRGPTASSERSRVPPGVVSAGEAS
jgi:putative membrane protein